MLNINICSSILIILLLASRKRLHERYSARTVYTFWKCIMLLSVPLLIKLPVASVGRRFAMLSPGGQFPASSICRRIYAGILIMLLTYGVVSYRNMLKQSQNYNVDNSFAIKLGRFRHVTLLYSQAISTSFSFGIIHSYIYLSDNPLYDEPEKRCILTHELLHVFHRDNLFKVIGYIVCSINWFNPFIWLAYKYMNADCEIATDENTIKKLGDDYKTVYLQALIKSGCSGRTNAFANTFGKYNNELKERVDIIMNKKSQKSVAWAVPVIVLVSLLLFAMIHICVVPSTQSNAEQSTATQNDSESFDQSEESKVYEELKQEETHYELEEQNHQTVTVTKTDYLTGEAETATFK